MSLAHGLNVPADLVERPTDPFWWYLRQPAGGDIDALERVWSELDRRLDDQQLRAEHVERDVRIVAVLGLFAIRVDARMGDVTAWSIEHDGKRRRIGRGFVVRDPFAHGWWLRFAFQRFAPHLTNIDFVECPLNRPSSIELETSRRLSARLGVDRRYWQMRDAYDGALGIPTHVYALLGDRADRAMAHELTKRWRRTLFGHPRA